MSDENSTFDPYHKWLGIPPQEQPPHHYRLLGIAAFESDVDVIESAAEQRMAHVRARQTGAYGALTQKLLNEISAASTLLLDAQRKRAYDDNLRASLPAKSMRPHVPVAKPLSQPPQFQSTSAVRTSQNSRPASRHLIVGICAVGALGLMAAAVVAGLAFQRNGENPVASANQKSASSRRDGVASTAPNSSAMPGQPPLSTTSDVDTDGNRTTPPQDPEIEAPVPTPPEASSECPLPDRQQASDPCALEAARDAAIADGDVEAALKAVDAIIAEEQGDPFAAKMAALQRMSAPTDATAHAEQLVLLAEGAVASDRLDALRPYIGLVLLAARRSDNPAMIRRATVCALKCQEE